MRSPDVLPGFGIIPDRERCPRCRAWVSLKVSGGIMRHTKEGKRINGTTKDKEECL